MIEKASPAPFEYELELLKVELDTITSSIRQMDVISKDTKQWTIALWTAAVGGALATPSLRDFVGFTAVIPLLLGYVEASYRQIQRRFIWRSEFIGKLLRSDALRESFKKQCLQAFMLWDPAGWNTGGKECRDFARIGKVISFPSLYLLYGGLTLLSLVLGILVHVIPSAL